MTTQRKGGIIQLNIDGVLYDAKGAFTYGLGVEKREAIVGADGVHGYKATPQVAFIEGEITDRAGLDLKKFFTLEGVTLTLTLANGKTVMLREAWHAGDGSGSSEEGAIAIRFEGAGAEEIS